MNQDEPQHPKSIVTGDFAHIGDRLGLERIRREIAALRIVLLLPAACVVIQFLVWLYRGMP